MESDGSDSDRSSNSDLVATVSRFADQIFDSLEIGVQGVFWSLLGIAVTLFFYYKFCHPARRVESLFMIRIDEVYEESTDEPEGEPVVEEDPDAAVSIPPHLIEELVERIGERREAARSTASLPSEPGIYIIPCSSSSSSDSNNADAEGSSSPDGEYLLCSAGSVRRMF